MNVLAPQETGSLVGWILIGPLLLGFLWWALKLIFFVTIILFAGCIIWTLLVVAFDSIFGKNVSDNYAE
jgi:hypothetical protein